MRMLEQLGYAAEAAEDGLQALAAHRAAGYDLILMDCEMPALDGYAATRRLRQEESEKDSGLHTPVLGLTAHTGAQQEEQCRQAGMDALLAKPLRPPMLREVLARWLAAAAHAPGTSATPAAGADELDAVRAMFGSDFADLAALYRNDGPLRLAALRTACDRRDRALLATVAHALGGSSASIGASGLATLCRELELRARAAPLDDCQAHLSRIEHEYRRISDKLQALLAH
jgi:CheY-like chemotaxis protein/HPt (histidine-containing phosphotransfer) domain-containing protein